MDIGKRIKQRREILGLTLEEVGSYLGVNKATIQRYENGVIDIKRTTAIKLSKILETTPAYIMGWSDDIQKTVMNQQLSDKEQLLLNDFRKLNSQGQEYILQTMDMVKDKYKKDNTISNTKNMNTG